MYQANPMSHMSAIEHFEVLISEQYIFLAQLAYFQSKLTALAKTDCKLGTLEAKLTAPISLDVLVRLA